jgi:hypothetical protein
MQLCVGHAARCLYITDRSDRWCLFASLNARITELQGIHASTTSATKPIHSATLFNSRHIIWRSKGSMSYCTISAIVPAPTVCPPSRMAKRKPFSIATGVISSITSETLSPGITISVPAGNSATPVTSVVRK